MVRRFRPVRTRNATKDFIKASIECRCGLRGELVMVHVANVTVTGAQAFTLDATRPAYRESG